MASDQGTTTFKTGAQNISTGPKIQSLGRVGDQYLLTHETLDRTLRGVVVATKLDDERQKIIKDWLSQQQQALDSKPLSVNQWLEASKSRFSEEPELHVVTDFIIGIAYMRERGRHENVSKDPLSLDFIWPIIYAALTTTNNLFRASRSAVGLIFVPLCSLIKDGAIEELWRLHVWLPDGQRGDPEYHVHSHNTYGQSWILAGFATNHRWSVEPAADKETATHAEYRVSWNDGKTQDSNYKTHQVSSTINNTHKYFNAKLLSTETEQQDMTYSVTHEEWHSSEVAPDAMLATLFFFDGHRGTNNDAAILGPKDGESSTQLRDSAGNTPEKVAKFVQAARA